MASNNRPKGALLFHALSDETRLKILDHLRNGEQCVCDLTDSLQTAQSRLSFHLKVLKDAGLIRDRPDGRWVYYSLDAKGLKLLEQVVEQLMPNAAAGKGRTSRCC